MKDVLYIGPYRQSDEWGQTAKAIVMALSQHDINLTCRPIWFNNEKNTALPDTFNKAEQNKVEKKQVLIQHGLPSYLNPNYDFETNIAVLSVDCRINNMDWVTHLNMFDKVVVFSKYEKTTLIESGVKTEIVDFPCPPMFFNSDVADFQLDIPGFKFYSDANFSPNTGLRETIIAYLSSFTSLDDCVLILPSNNVSAFKERIEGIKSELGIYRNNDIYPRIAIIGSNDKATINKLHTEGECYISVGYNCRFSQSLLMAVLNHNLPIVLDTLKTSFEDWDFTVSSYQECCMAKNRPLPGLYSGKQSWKKPLISSIGFKMKSMYAHYRADTIEQLEDKLIKSKDKLFSIDWEKICS